MAKSDLGQAVHAGIGPLAAVFDELGADRHAITVTFVDKGGRRRERCVSPFIVGDAAFRLDESLMTPFRCIHHGRIPCCQYAHASLCTSVVASHTNAIMAALCLRWCAVGGEHSRVLRMPTTSANLPLE